MNYKNKYGLKRTIPSGIRREIRQRCGFGCVVCGIAIYEYHHFDPPYCDAKQHDPSKIVLLCPICHSSVTSGLLSFETITKFACNPKAKEVGYSYFGLDIGEQQPRIKLGTATFQQVKSLIEVGSSRFFNILPPEVSGGPFRLTAYFLNQYGTPIAQIVENEWRNIGSSWDIELTGNKIAIRQQKGDISLVIQADAPHGLVIKKMNMWFEGMNLSIEEDSDLVIKGPMCPGNLQKTITLSRVYICNVLVGVKMPCGNSSYWRTFTHEDCNMQISGIGDENIAFHYQAAVDGVTSYYRPSISSHKLIPGTTIYIR